MIETSHVTKNPQRECITLDRTPSHIAAATKVRKQLCRSGFSPIPVIGKRPALPDWQHKTHTNDGEIDLWAQLLPDATGTGILTKWTPALDIDILDPDAAEAVEALARERFEDGRFLVRIGRAPKRAILFRADTPFRKIAVALIAPNGTNGQQLEILGDGQQIVARGIHPDIGRAYGWHGGRPGEVRRSELPEITETEARALISGATALLTTEFGYRVVRQNGASGVSGQRKVRSADEWRALFSSTIPEGGRNDTVARLAGHLLRRDVDPLVVLQLLQSWNAAYCVPPLPPEEVTRTVDSICSAELRRRGACHG